MAPAPGVTLCAAWIWSYQVAAAFLFVSAYTRGAVYVGFNIGHTQI